MKTKTMLVAFFCLFLLIFPFNAYAGAPPGDWVSGFACQNMDNNIAEINISFHQENHSNSSLDYYDTIPAHGRKNYYTPSSPPGVPDPFLGSVVIGTRRNVICSVNTQTTSSGTKLDPYRMATSAGFLLYGDETRSTSYAPQVMKNYSGWNSYIAIKNALPNNVTVDITYKDSNGADIPAAAQNDIPIKGMSNKILYQVDNAGLGSSFIGSAKIMASAGNELAVTVHFYNDNEDFKNAQIHGYTAFKDGVQRLFVPRFVRRFHGYNSGISIQNVGSINTTVAITFKFADQTYIYVSGWMVPGQSIPLYATTISALNPVDNLPIHLRDGSASINANSGAKIVAIVNEDNRGLPADNDGNPVPENRIGQGSTYDAVADGNQTTGLFFPQIMRKVSGIFSGGFQVKNTADSDGSCDISYYGASGANETNVPIPANGSFTRFAPEVTNLPDGFNSSVSLDCDVNVVGIFNFAVDTSSKYGDSYASGNGYNP